MRYRLYKENELVADFDSPLVPIEETYIGVKAFDLTDPTERARVFNERNEKHPELSQMKLYFIKLIVLVCNYESNGGHFYMIQVT